MFLVNVVLHVYGKHDELSIHGCGSINEQCVSLTQTLAYSTAHVMETNIQWDEKWTIRVDSHPLKRRVKQSLLVLRTPNRLSLGKGLRIG